MTLNKRTIALGVLIILGVLIAGYFLLRDTSTPATPGTSGTFPAVGEPVTASVPGTTTGFFDDQIDASSRPVQAAARLVKITDGPVAIGLAARTVSGTSTASSTSSADVAVRYIERASGNMYEYRQQERAITRLTNRTIPGVFEAAWLLDGSRAYVRYVSNGTGNTTHIETYALPMSGDGQLLARDLSQIFPDGTASVITLSSSDTGSIATRTDIGGIGGTTVFQTPLSRLFAFATDRGMYVHTPASALAESYVFLVRAGQFERIPAPAKGMTVLPSPNGKILLVSYINDSGALQTGIIDPDTATLTKLPIATLTEKCVFTKDSLHAYCGVPASAPEEGIIPDDWYQGAIGFRDRLWEIDFGSRLALFTADLPKLTDAPIDAVSLATDENQSVLFFINRNDGSLWAYEL